MKRTIIFSLIVFAAIFSATSAAQNIQAKVIKSIPVQSTHEFVDSEEFAPHNKFVFRHKFPYIRESEALPLQLSAQLLVLL